MEKPTGLRVEFYQDVHNDWRWTQWAENGKIRGASSQGFTDIRDAKANWRNGVLEGLECIQNSEVYIKSATLEYTRV